MEKLLVLCDGGSRGNPGPAAVGVIIKDEKENILARFGKRIGETTNNVAEYQAAIEALKWFKENKHLISRHPHVLISFYLDSRLVVNQINGFFKIKDSRLRELLLEIRELEAELGGNISYHLIPRQENRLADSLVNQSLES